MSKKSSKTIYDKVDHLLVLDVGTTGIKAFVFNKDFKIDTRTYRPIKTSRPKKDWVEQDPMEILTAAKQVLKEAMCSSHVKLNHFSAFGLTNQRETVVAWDRVSGKPIYPAIVWEDRRRGRELRIDTNIQITNLIRNRTGLKLGQPK